MVMYISFQELYFNVIIDPGSTFAYRSTQFAQGFDKVYDILDSPINVSTLAGKCVKVIHVYIACPFTFMNFQTRVNFFILHMISFYRFLGLSWLYPYYVVLNIYTKFVTLEITSRVKLEQERVFRPRPIKVISFIRAKKLMGKRCST